MQEIAGPKVMDLEKVKKDRIELKFEFNYKVRLFRD